jgi:medium-chain acyl-[acyl-carrier-protein] hydrolase
VTTASSADGPARGVWFPQLSVPSPASSARTRLFAVPYAGGSAGVFKRFERRLSGHVDVVAVQPPGRRERLGEPPLRSATEMAEHLGRAMLPLLDRPFALFGISMGALVAFETARWLRRLGRPARHLFVASYPGPRWPPRRPPVHGAPDAVVLAVLGELGLTPPEVLADREMLDVVLPLVRADLAVTETYSYHADAPLDVPLTALYGRDDGMLPPAAVARWGWETTAAFRTVDLDCGHFLLTERPDETADAVLQGLGVP